MEGVSSLVAVPDNALHVVLCALYPLQAATYSSSTVMARKRDIECLAMTCRSLRDAIRRVRTQAGYCFVTMPGSGCSNAEHLDRHTACNTLQLSISSKPTFSLSQLTAFLRSIISTGASLRVAHLSICCYGLWGPFDLDTPVVLTVARALQELQSITLHHSITVADHFFADLAASCPHLNTLQAIIPSLSPEAVSSLSALSRLISLTLHEGDADAGSSQAEAEGLPHALLQQLSSWTALTHLGLRFSASWHGGIQSPSFRHVVPMLAHLPLRSLELTGHCCSLGMHDFPAIARALPSLEWLRGRCLLGYEEDADATHEPWDRKVWRMPKLTAIEIKTTAGWEACTIGADEVLDIAASCPALQRLEGVGVEMDLRTRCYDQVVTASLDFDVKALRHWVQGLAALAARRVLARVDLLATSSQQVVGLCTALEQLQPASHRTALASCIGSRVLDDEIDQEALSLLEASLPRLSMARVEDSADEPMGLWDLLAMPYLQVD